MTITLQAERPEHADGVERVLHRAFGPGRFAKTSERVRERGALHEPSLSRVAIEADEHQRVVGICRLWRVDAGAPLLFLGPLAVDPSAQSAGLGLRLVQASVAAARASAAGGIVLVGAQRFFEPAGFSPVPPGRIALPGPVDPARLLWLELRPGGLDKVAGAIGRPRA